MTDFLRGVVAVRGLLVVWVAWVAVTRSSIDLNMSYGGNEKNA